MNADLLGDIMLLSFFEMGIVIIAIPACLVYPVVCRLCKGEWRNLYSWYDIASCLAMHAIWLYGFTHDFNHRGVGRIQDIVVLGCIYGVLVLLRIPFVWQRPEWRARIAMLSFLLLVSTAIMLTWFVNLAECAD